MKNIFSYFKNIFRNRTSKQSDEIEPILFDPTKADILKDDLSKLFPEFNFNFEPREVIDLQYSVRVIICYTITMDGVELTNKLQLSDIDRRYEKVLKILCDRIISSEYYKLKLLGL